MVVCVLRKTDDEKRVVFRWWRWDEGVFGCKWLKSMSEKYIRNYIMNNFIYIQGYFWTKNGPSLLWRFWIISYKMLYFSRIISGKMNIGIKFKNNWRDEKATKLNTSNFLLITYYNLLKKCTKNCFGLSPIMLKLLGNRATSTWQQWFNSHTAGPEYSKKRTSDTLN